jgi:hypothetical protein
VDWDALQMNGGTETVLGRSQHLQKYVEYRNAERDRKEASALFLTGIALNHIVSAVDAVWAAQSHNKGIYAKQRLGMRAPVGWGSQGVMLGLAVTGQF